MLSQVTVRAPRVTRALPGEGVSRENQAPAGQAQGIGHLTEERIVLLANLKIPHMADALGATLSYTGRIID